MMAGGMRRFLWQLKNLSFTGAWARRKRLRRALTPRQDGVLHRSLLFLAMAAAVSSAAAFDVKLGADGLAFPSLDARLELLLPKAPGWQSALIAPADDAFENLTNGVLTYLLREKTGHSWTYGMGQGRLSVQPTASGELVVSNVVTYSADLALQTAAFRLRLPRKLFDSGTWRLDGRTGTWPTVTTASVREASFTLPSLDEELTFRFDEPVQVRFQDDAKAKTDTYSIWFGRLAPHAVKPGDVWTLASTLVARTPVKVSTASKVVIGEDASWSPVDFRQTVRKDSALDLSSLVRGDAPAGKHGWLANAGGRFAFADDPSRAVRFYGLNLCFSANLPSHDEADELAERFVRMGYNAVRIHHHDGLLGWRKAQGGDAFDAAAMDRLDYFLSRLFAKGIYATTDLYVSRPVTWSELGLVSPDGQKAIPRQAVKGVLMMTDAGYANWWGFSRDLLSHVNPYTQRAYKDEPALPLLALINENPITMGWHELRTFPFVRKMWRERFGTDDCARIAEGDRRLDAFAAEVEERFFRRAKADLVNLGTKALLTDLSCGGATPGFTKIRRENYDYADFHFYIDHPQFLTDRRWQPPQQIGGTNPFRSKRLRPFFLREDMKTPELPFTSTEWSFVGPGRYRGAGGIATGAAAALNDWGGAWRFAYAHRIATAMKSKGHVGCFDVATDPAQQLADRASILLFLRGDLASGDTKACRLDAAAGALTIETLRTCGGFRERGTIETASLTVKLGESAGAVWASSLDAAPLAQSGRILVTHLTDVQNAGATFADEGRTILLGYGKGGLRALDGTAEIALKLDEPRFYRVHSLALDGERRGVVQARVLNGRLVFTARVLAPDGKARFLYEIVRTKTPVGYSVGTTGPVPPGSVRGVYRDEADYLLRKFREDATDPTSGLDNTQLAALAEKMYAAANPPVEDWSETKAEIIRAFCEKMAIGASGYDWFPAIACWDRNRRPLNKVICDLRNGLVDRLCCPAESARAEAGNRAGRWTMWKDFDHSVPEWSVILKLGFPGMKARLKANWKETSYCRAGEKTIDAVLNLVARFERQAQRELASGRWTGHRRERLVREVASLRRLRTGAPQTAYDAMMFIWVYFFASEHLERMQVRSLSNLDVCLKPFYRADIAAGRTTEAEFREQLRHFWWQWGSIDNYWCQPVSIGGTRPDGTTQFDDFTKIVLDVHDECALPTPKLLVKTNPRTPDWAWKKMLDMHRRHRSLCYIGEESVAKVFAAFGYDAEDARTAELRGCYEVVPAKGMNRTTAGHLNLVKPVERMLAEGADAAEWETFRAAYLSRVRAATAEMREIVTVWGRHLEKVNPAILFSLATTYSVEHGVDAFARGTEKGNNTGINITGLGTAVDALLAVKELVFEKRELSLSELGKILSDDWKDREELRLRMSRSKRKWGNNDAEANTLAAEIVSAYAGELNGRPNGRNGRFLANGHCARQFVVLGRQTGATPDGRHAGDEFSKNVSPAPGADTEGVTALVLGVTSLDSRLLPGDFPLDVMLHPSLVAGEKGLETMRSVVETYHARGGVQIHFNVVDPAELRDAQLHPERYGNLQVRVCGWNVRWNDLDRREQDAYLQRLEAMPIP